MPSDDLSTIEDREAQKNLHSNGVTGLHQFRLDSLEKRIETLETDAKTLLIDTATIKARLDTMPTQANVYWLFAGALIVNFVTLVGHLLIRSLSSP